MKNFFAACLLMASALTGAVVSCSGGDGPYMSRLEGARANPDELKALREDLAEDPEGADALLAGAYRTGPDRYSVAIAVTKTPEEAAGIVLSNPSRELSTRLGAIYRANSDRSEFNRYTGALLQGFNALGTVDKVKFLTGMASASECGQYLEPGDQDLADALRRHFAQNADSLRAFEQGILRQH